MTKTFLITLPDDDNSRLKTAAISNGRSRKAEAEQIIKERVKSVKLTSSTEAVS